VLAAYRINCGLDFAAIAIGDVMAALVVKPHRLPGYAPHRKGMVERVHLTIDETLLKGLPRFTEGPGEAPSRPGCR
jgi:putative transposase